jgi:hypothetical protein
MPLRHGFGAIRIGAEKSDGCQEPHDYEPFYERSPDEQNNPAHSLSLCRRSAAGTSGLRRRAVRYGYLPLPLTEPKPTTGGKNVPTGDTCWTLFLSTRNFKGPVCFFTPYFWSHSAVVNPDYAGLLLDSRSSAPNKPFLMETQYVPGALWARWASTVNRRATMFWPCVRHRPRSRLSRS